MKMKKVRKIIHWSKPEIRIMLAAFKAGKTGHEVVTELKKAGFKRTRAAVYARYAKVKHG